LLAENNFEVNLTNLVQGERDFINDLITRAATINKQLGGSRKRRGANTNEIDMKIEIFRKYRYKLHDLLKGMKLLEKASKTQTNFVKDLIY